MDDEGLPVVYSQEGIQQYWSDKSGELLSRWTQFLALGSPFILKVITNAVSGNMEKNEGELTSDLR